MASVIAVAGLRYYHPEHEGWITLVSRRKIHVLTNTGGVDKIRMIYRYECDVDGCGYTTTAIGLTGIRKAADAHRYGLHKPIPRFPWRPEQGGPPAPGEEPPASAGGLPF